MGNLLSICCCNFGIPSSGVKASQNIEIYVASEAFLINNRSRNNLVFERSLFSGTQRSSLRIILTLFQSKSNSQSLSKIGPGVLPPGTEKITFLLSSIDDDKSDARVCVTCETKTSLSLYSKKLIKVFDANFDLHALEELNYPAGQNSHSHKVLGHRFFLSIL